MRHLILYLEDSEEDEVFYELKDIVNIHFEEMVAASIDSMERCENARLEAAFCKCIMPLFILT